MFPYFRNRSYSPCPRCESWVAATEDRCASCDYLISERDKQRMQTHRREQQRKGMQWGLMVSSALIAAAIVAYYLQNQ